jgi:restriction endonuclease
LFQPCQQSLKTRILSKIIQVAISFEENIAVVLDSRRIFLKSLAYRDLTAAVIDLLAAYQIERHIRKDKDEGVNRLKKEIALSPEFQALWDRIKPKTTYRVEFETEALVNQAVATIKKMERIEAPRFECLPVKCRSQKRA